MNDTEQDGGAVEQLQKLADVLNVEIDEETDSIIIGDVQIELFHTLNGQMTLEETGDQDTPGAHLFTSDGFNNAVEVQLSYCGDKNPVEDDVDSVSEILDEEEEARSA